MFRLARRLVLARIGGRCVSDASGPVCCGGGDVLAWRGSGFVCVGATVCVCVWGVGCEWTVTYVV